MTHEEIESQLEKMQRELAANGPILIELEIIQQWQCHQENLVCALYQISVDKESSMRWLGIWEQLEELRLQLRLEFDLARGGDARESQRALERWYQAGESRKNSMIAVKPAHHYLSLRKERKLNA